MRALKFPPVRVMTPKGKLGVALCTDEPRHGLYPIRLRNGTLVMCDPKKVRVLGYA